MISGAITWSTPQGELEKTPKGLEDLKDWISETLSYEFSDPRMLYPLSTRSRADQVINYEKLEFLGDAVLSVSVAEKLLESNPRGHPIDFARPRYSDLVSNVFITARVNGLGLTKVAPTLQIEGLKPKRPADAAESIIGAIYLDGGYEPASAAVIKILGESSFLPTNSDAAGSENVALLSETDTTVEDPFLKNLPNIPHVFSDSTLLTTAMSPFRPGYERVCPVHDRLHWLGHRLISLHLAELLFLTFPTAQEGELSEHRYKHSSDEMLARASRQMGFPARPNDMPPFRRYLKDDQYLASIFEAVTGATYIDGGIEASRGFISSTLLEEIDSTSTPPHSRLYPTLSADTGLIPLLAS